MIIELYNNLEIKLPICEIEYDNEKIRIGSIVEMFTGTILEVKEFRGIFFEKDEEDDAQLTILIYQDVTNGCYVDDIDKIIKY